MNLARARELGISRQVEPALRGVTHVSTPRARRRRSRRLTPDETADAAQQGRAAEPPASGGEESDEAHAADAAAEVAPSDGGDEPAADGDAEPASKPGVTQPLARADAAGDDEAALLAERAADGVLASCSAAAAAANLPPVSAVTLLDASNWMGQLAAALWDLPLHKIRMPGTHDSGARRRAARRSHRSPS